MADTTGQADLRAENVSKIVTGFALQEYKLKPLLMQSSSNSWQESYYKETKTELTGGTGSAVKGVPRLANFPYGEVSWTKASAYQEKYGMEGVISWEDSVTNNVDVIARTLLRIARAVTNAVDIQIESAIRAASGINTFALTALYEWDAVTLANRDPIGDLLKAKRYIATDNYDIDGGNGFVAMNPIEYEYLLNNSKVINNPSFKTADVISNGVVGQIVGLKIIVSNAITTDNVIVGIAKEMGTWKAASPLRVVTLEEPGINYKIRAWEVGVAQITNPEAICVITNTHT